MSIRQLAIVIAAVIALSSAAVLADGSEAANDISMGTPVVVSEFKENSDGTISVNISNSTSDGVATVKISAYEGSSLKATAEAVVEPGESRSVELTFALGAGSRTVTTSASAEITADGVTTSIPSVPGSGASVTIEVGTSIWSGWVPYVVLVIVAIIVILMIYIWYRGRPARTPAVTFSDLESGKVKVPEAPVATEKKKYVRQEKSEEGKTERMRYLSDRRK